MATKKTKKTKIIEGFKIHDTDTGSTEVQAGILTEQIKRLTQHLKTHRKDNHSRYGLLKMVAKRKKLLDYLQKEDDKRYEDLINKLEIKR